MVIFTLEDTIVLQFRSEAQQMCKQEVIAITECDLFTCILHDITWYSGVNHCLQFQNQASGITSRNQSSVYYTVATAVPVRSVHNSPLIY